jgi:hypothetical protein
VKTFLFPFPYFLLFGPTSVSARLASSSGAQPSFSCSPSTASPETHPGLPPLVRAQPSPSTEQATALASFRPSDSPLRLPLSHWLTRGTRAVIPNLPHRTLARVRATPHPVPAPPRLDPHAKAVSSGLFKGRRCHPRSRFPQTLTIVRQSPPPIPRCAAAIDLRCRRLPAVMKPPRSCARR